jgi:ADP-heptose:LPS heptosyltransferase
VNLIILRCFSVKPILTVFEFYQLGDGILSLPFLRGAMERYRVVVCCQPNVAELYSLCLPGIETVRCQPSWRKMALGVRQESAGAGLWECVRCLRKLKPDVAVSIWPDPRVHFLMACSGARRRIGFAVGDQNIWAPKYLPKRRAKVVAARSLAGFAQFITCHPWLHRALDKDDFQQPHWANWRQLSNELALPWRDELPWATPDRVVNDAQVAAFLHRHQSSSPVYLMHSGARNPANRWFKARFQGVIDNWFVPRQVPLIIIDSGQGNTPAAVDDRQLVYKPGNLADFLALLANVDCVLCNDSFPAHAAAALGKKVYTVMSSANPNWFAPFGNESRVIQKDACEFRPCLDYCKKPSYICLEAVTVWDVIKKLDEEYRAAEI